MEVPGIHCGKKVSNTARMLNNRYSVGPGPAHINPSISSNVRLRDYFQIHSYVLKFHTSGQILCTIASVGVA